MTLIEEPWQPWQTLKVFIKWQLQAGPIYYDDFIAIVQVAQNRLKFGMSTLFVLRNVPVYFSRMQKNIDKTTWNSTPPLCPSPNIGFQSLRAKTLCMCLLRYWSEVCVCVWGGGGGGGGGLSRTCSKPFFPACEKKNHSRHAKFQSILSNLENRISHMGAGLHGALHLSDLFCRYSSGGLAALLEQTATPVASTRTTKVHGKCTAKNNSFFKHCFCSFFCLFSSAD